MNSPYEGRFQVTQQFKGSAHDGLDLVGLDSKDIHATVTGKVIYAGWENEANHKQGFGQFVCILGPTTITLDTCAKSKQPQALRLSALM